MQSEKEEKKARESISFMKGRPCKKYAEKQQES